MWYNDDDIEKAQSNWKNSEVTRIFAEQFLPKLAGEKEPVEDVENDCGDMPEEEEKELVVVLEPVAVATQEVNGVIEKLSRLAEESMEYGNERVTYMIERTIKEVEEIRNELSGA